MYLYGVDGFEQSACGVFRSTTLVKRLFSEKKGCIGGGVLSEDVCVCVCLLVTAAGFEQSACGVFRSTTLIKRLFSKKKGCIGGGARSEDVCVCVCVYWSPLRRLAPRERQQTVPF